MNRFLSLSLLFAALTVGGCSCDERVLMSGQDGGTNGSTNATNGDGGTNGSTNATNGDGGTTNGTTNGDGGTNGTTNGDGGTNGTTNGTTNGDGGSTNDGGTTNGGGDGGAVNGGGDGGTGGCVPLGAHCGGVPCQCEDCLDNDNDGFRDIGDDLECTSYYDNNEADFTTGIPGDNLDCGQDCFFDGNSGGGGMDCQIPTACIAADIADYNTKTGSNCQPLDPNAGTNGDCVMSQTCKEECLRYVPNGCDCYGCCDILAPDGMTYSIMVGSPCDVGSLQNGNYGDCIQCVQDPICVNECGRCELCPGRTIDDLPSDCFPPPPVDAGMGDGGPVDVGTPTDGGTPLQCEGGLQACGSTLPPCASTEICFFGCCLLDIGG